ncbi:hypothetical protein C6Y40_22525 [Alteromonas alba]|uniref:Uncharacterized protein n=1 Tax=Alteromonas alba TaxID=2079529 RepID=A0A2S9V4H2_9ALTE|nr:hypothetical protein C6Y40_22525 [Alteromonas alba]
MAPLWKPSSSLIAKVHTVTGQVKPIGQRGRPALLTGAIIHDASSLLLDLPGDSISRYKEPNKKQKHANAPNSPLLVIPEAALAAIRYLQKSFAHPKNTVSGSQTV